MSSGPGFSRSLVSLICDLFHLSPFLLFLYFSSFFPPLDAILSFKNEMVVSIEFISIAKLDPEIRLGLEKKTKKKPVNQKDHV